MDEHSGNIPSLKDLYRDIQKDLDEVEIELRRFADSSNPIISEISGYLFRKSGKRIRPALVMLCAKLYGYSGREHIPISAMVEAIHTASLIHDDIIDNSDTRRGQPTVHSRWGRNITVLLGDYLYIKTLHQSLDNRFSDITRILTGASARMIDGELFEYHQSSNLALEEKVHLDILGKKTASLFAASCQIGSLMGGAAPDEQKGIAAFGWYLGMAFQLIDDLLDYTGNLKTLGKPILADLKEGRITLPLIYALRQTDEKTRKHVQGLYESRHRNHQACGEILEFVRSNGALDYTFEKASEFAHRSVAELESLPDTDSRKTLSLIPVFILKRNR